ncbi:hypothetical protein ACFQ48_15080 [Hymenobacter caeli]|uniref:Phosphoribosylanthranilate isomerase n=1 Tax=Hymenobacter caeli TaxID=2735894 RepID=A0ABX2FR28_9BACT|nr:hypothetical protein [Hymenobacter caeli]NRT19647.1 phosphoribosylanthranilate isomerase [Hymenobacter caeli]
MALRIPVLVRGINNLSDARYCAGMGAAGLVFTLDPELPGAIDPATVQELAGWVAGVALIGEFGDADPEQLIAVATACGLHQVLLHDAPLFIPGLHPPLPFPVLRETDLITALQALIDPELAHELRSADFAPAGGALLVTLPAGADLVGWQDQLAALARRFPLWLGGDFAVADLPGLVDAVRPYGLVLRGGDELKPGLRDFGGLEELFEALEEVE